MQGGLGFTMIMTFSHMARLTFKFLTKHIKVTDHPDYVTFDKFLIKKKLCDHNFHSEDEIYVAQNGYFSSIPTIE